MLGNEALVGVSCHSAAEVRRAREAGASYASVSPIYDTPSKRAYGAPVGLVVLREAAASGLPVIALGGITPVRVPEVLAAGAHGVAAIRAWLEGDDPAAAGARFRRPIAGHPPPGLTDAAGRGPACGFRRRSVFAIALARAKREEVLVGEERSFLR